MYRITALLGVFLSAGATHADSLKPFVIGGTIDRYFDDGVADEFDDGPFIAATSSGEYRALVEYDLRGIPTGTVLSASLTGTVGPNNSFNVGRRDHIVEVYTGNGQIDLSDHSVPAIKVGEFSHPSGASTDFEFDIQGVLHNLLAAGADFIGMRISTPNEQMPFEVLYSNEAFPDAPRLHFEFLPEGVVTQSYAPLADAEVRLSDDGAELMEGRDSISVQQVAFADIDRRAILEYDLSDVPANAIITDAKITFDIWSYGGGSSGDPEAPIFAYAGNGMLEVADALESSTQVGTLSVHGLDPTIADLDHHAIQALLAESAIIGFGVHGDPNYNSVGFTAIEFPGTSPPPAILTLSYVLPIGLPGDFNSDSQVNLADYTVWRDSLGQTGAGLAADGNGDSVVDALDYAGWKENFGRSSASSASFEASKVPEPRSMAIACLLVAMVGISSRVRTIRSADNNRA